VADATITTATLACKKPVKQAEPVTVCCCGDPTILETWHRKDRPCFAPQMVEPVVARPQRRSLTDEERRAMWRASDFRGNGGQMDWFIEGTRAAEVAHGITGKQAEPVAESHRRATTGASGQSMTQADSGNPSF